MTTFTMTIEVELEDDGRYIGAVPELPGVLVYGATRQAAISAAAQLAIAVLLDRIEAGELDAGVLDHLSIRHAA